MFWSMSHLSLQSAWLSCYFYIKESWYCQCFHPCFPRFTMIEHIFLLWVSLILLGLYLCWPNHVGLTSSPYNLTYHKRFDLATKIYLRIIQKNLTYRYTEKALDLPFLILLYRVWLSTKSCNDLCFGSFRNLKIDSPICWGFELRSSWRRRNILP